MAMTIEQRHVLHRFLRHTRVWEAAYSTVLWLHDHVSLLPGILESADGCWDGIEEDLSLTIRRDLRKWTGDDAYEVAYYAAFAILLAHLRITHPGIQAPEWFLRDVAPELAPQAGLAADVASVARDMFLEGRDQQAIALLLSEYADREQQKPVIYWNERLWDTVLPVNGDSDAMMFIGGSNNRPTANPREAVGQAMDAYGETTSNGRSCGLSYAAIFETPQYGRPTPRQAAAMWGPGVAPPVSSCTLSGLRLGRRYGEVLFAIADSEELMRDLLPDDER